MQELMPGYKQLINRYPMAVEWLGALETVRSRMRHAALQSEATGDPNQRYFSEQLLEAAAPEPWQLAPDDSGLGDKPLTPASVPLAVLGALAGAVIAAVTWSALAFVLRGTLVFLALGLGVCVGYGVLLVSDGRRGRLMQGIALAGTLFGYVLGKYLALELVANATAYGTTVGGFYETIRSTMVFTPGALGQMLAQVSASVGPLDLFIMLLSLWTAWRMVAPWGTRRPRSQATTTSE